MDDTETRIFETRLLVSRPEDVFEGLKDYGTRIGASKSSPHFGNKDFENNLLLRDEPLIDLGLACFASDATLVATLYTKAVTPVPHTGSPSYWKGVRIGCLSNKVARGVFNWLSDDIIGKENLLRLVSDADLDEVQALLCNPRLSDKLLKELYRRDGPFSDLSDERWLYLVSASTANRRLTTEYDFFDSPDMGHYDIHKAIFGLLEAAPVTLRSAHTIYHLIEGLDPSQVHRAPEIDHVLARWLDLEIEMHKGEARSGYYTNLPWNDEFRCLIAAVYGKLYSDGKMTVVGSPEASDVALRCAYYGNATLSLKEMKNGFARDESAFEFSALHNDGLFTKMELRKQLEENLWGEQFHIYRRRCAQIHERLNWFDPRPLSDHLEERDESADDAQQGVIDWQNRVEQKIEVLGEIQRKIEVFGEIIKGFGPIGVALLVYLPLRGDKVFGFDVSFWVALAAYILSRYSLDRLWQKAELGPTGRR